METKVARLREILKDQIDWYNKNKSDENYIYDCAIDEFSSLNRGDYQNILEILADEESI